MASTYTITVTTTDKLAAAKVLGAITRQGAGVTVRVEEHKHFEPAPDMTVALLEQIEADELGGPEELVTRQPAPRATIPPYCSGSARQTGARWQARVTCPVCGRRVDVRKGGYLGSHRAR